MQFTCKHILQIFICFQIVIVLISCSREKPKGENNLKLDLSKKISLPLKDADYWSPYTAVMNKNDTTYLIRSNPMCQNIQMYNLKSRELYKLIEFQHPELSGKYMRGGIGFIPFNLDSMYITNRDRKMFLIGNDSIYEKFEIDFHKNNPVISFRNESRLIRFNDSLFGMAQFKPYAYFTDEFMESSIFALFNKNTGEPYDATISFPKDVYAGNCWVPGLLRPSYTYNRDKQKVIFSFPADHNLYEYDFADDTTIQISQPPNRNFDEIPSYAFCDQDRQMQDLYTMSTPHYFSIVYDPLQRVYFRFFLMPPDQIEEREIIWIKKRLGVVVLDEEFRLIHQTLFDHYQFNPRDFYIDDEGLWLSNNNPEGPHFSEDSIQFTLLKLTHVDTM